MPNLSPSLSLSLTIHSLIHQISVDMCVVGQREKKIVSAKNKRKQNVRS